MRVLIFAPNYLPATRYGGPVHSSHGLAKALVQLGHEVFVLTTNADGPGVLDVPLLEVVNLDGVKVFYCPIKIPRRLYYSPKMAALAEKLIPIVDVVHINGVFLWPGFCLATIARRLQRPVVVSPRGMLTPELVNGKSKYVKLAWIALRERKVLSGAKAIHVTSDVEAAGLRQMGLDLAKVSVIPNGVDGPLKLPSTLEIENVWQGIPEGRRVGFLARLDWTKGVDLAIEAVRNHPNAFLMIAGHDQSGLRDKLEPRLFREDGTRAGLFLGPLNGSRKWAFLQGADILLAPSVQESFGMSVAEALCVGTPTIVTQGVGARSIVEAVDPALVVERSAEGVLQALTLFLEDSSRRHLAGILASSILTDRYGWDVIARNMSKLYQRIASK